MGQWKDGFLFYLSRHPGDFRTAYKWQPAFRSSFIWLLLYSSNTFFFADPRPCHVLEEEEAIHLNIYNALSEGKRDFKNLVTTTKLQKHDFYPGGAALLKNSRRQRITFDWTLGSTARSQHTPPSKIVSSYPIFFLPLYIYIYIYTHTICMPLTSFWLTSFPQSLAADFIGRNFGSLGQLKRAGAP